MIDNISLKTASITEAEFERIVNRLGLIVNVDKEIIKFSWKNLRLKYYPNQGHLIISNSIHKFYNLEFGEIKQAINSNDFTLSNFYTAVDFISEFVLQRSVKEIFVTGLFEFGLNIEVDISNSFDLISKYISSATTHLNEFYTIPPLKGKPKQRTCYLSDYRIKAYQKQPWNSTTISTSLMRFEVVVTELRKLKAVLGKTSISVNELLEVQSWEKMNSFVLYCYDNIRKIPAIDDLKTSLDDLNKIYAYSNKLLRDDIQRLLTRHQFSKVNRANKNVYQYYDCHPLNYHITIREKIVQKLNYIINN